MKIQTVDTYQVNIYIAGDLHAIKQTCSEYVMQGLCVTVNPTTFIYTGGVEEGAIVGLRNYPRFPSTPKDLKDHGQTLAIKLIDHCYQRTALVLTPDKTYWISRYEQEQ